jgi:hypothetical protein
MRNFNWNEFYRLAEYLHNEYSFECQEAVQRTIVSRAYYASFCMAKEALDHKYKISLPQNTASHAYVRFEYEKRGRNNISDSLNLLISSHYFNYQINVSHFLWEEPNNLYVFFEPL